MNFFDLLYHGFWAWFSLAVGIFVIKWVIDFIKENWKKEKNDQTGTTESNY